MESTGSRRHHQNQRPCPPPLQLQPHHGYKHARHPPGPRTTRRNPRNNSPAADLYAAFHMDDDAISTLMDADGSPRNVAGGFLDEEDGEVELFLGARRGGSGVAADVRGPLPFAGFFNGFDGADFDDADLD